MTRRTDTVRLDEALAQLDPAGPRTAAPDRGTPVELLARIVATDHTATPVVPADRSPAGRRRAPRLALAGGVTAAVAGLVLTVPLVTGGEEAFAGWSPVPVELTGAERDAAVTACTALQAEDGELAADPGAAADPLVVEARGGWTYVLYRVGTAGGGSLEGSCLMPDEVLDDPEPGTGGFFGSLGPAADSGAAPRRGDAVVEDASGLGEVDDGVFGYASGRVGADVARVVVTLADGREVEASVEAGRWAAWWPAGDDGARDPSVTGAWTPRGVLRDGTVLDPVDPGGVPGSRP
jgi:hypothetical protein